MIGKSQIVFCKLNSKEFEIGAVPPQKFYSNCDHIKAEYSILVYSYRLQLQRTFNFFWDLIQNSKNGQIADLCFARFLRIYDGNVIC